ncbi:MAG: hypothetical protein WD397_02125 [Wenzhouxiangellaceae bacterium]
MAPKPGTGGLWLSTSTSTSTSKTISPRTGVWHPFGGLMVFNFNLKGGFASRCALAGELLFLQPKKVTRISQRSWRRNRI